MRAVRDALPPALLIVLLGAAWELACRLFRTPVYVLPPPSLIAAALLDRGPLLAASALNTLTMALAALACASVVAMTMTLVAALSRTAEQALRPIAVTLQVTPVVAIAPLVVIWSGLDHPGRAVIALAAAVAFFPIFSGGLTGLKSADPDLERLFDLYGATPTQRLLRLRLPSAAPFIIEGHRVAAGLAVIGAIVAEFVAGGGGSQGLAWRILEAGNRLRTAEAFAALAVLAALGLAVHASVAALERWTLRRFSSGR